MARVRPAECMVRPESAQPLEAETAMQPIGHEEGSEFSD